MSRLMSVVWMVQFWILLGLSFTALIYPAAVLYVTDECKIVPSEFRCCEEPGGPVPDGLLSCSIPHGTAREMTSCDGCHEGCAEEGENLCLLRRRDPETEGLFALIRLLSPFTAVFALFSGHAAMRTDERKRRNLSFIFASIYMVLGTLLYTDNFGDAGFTSDSFLQNVLFSALAALLSFSLYLIVRAEDSARRSAGLIGALAYGSLLALLRMEVFDYKALAVATTVVLLVETIAGDLERTRARIFTVVLVFPLILLTIDFWDITTNAIEDETFVMRIVLGLVILAIVLHGQYAAWPIEAEEQKLSGSASTRPPSLWVLWLLQGLAFCGFAAALVYAHGHEAELFVVGITNQGYRSLFGDIDELYPAFFATVGLFSFSGMATSREWVWKAYCFIFAVFYGGSVVCLLFVWSPSVFAPWLLAFVLPAAFMCVAHIYYFRLRSEWFSEEVGEGPDGWVLSDVYLGPLLMMKTIFTKARASHARGVAAKGTLRVCKPDESDFPPNEVFRPGERMSVVMRYSNERAADDAEVDARGAAICLVTKSGTRFDLTLSTGAFSAAENIVELAILHILTSFGETGRRILSRSRQFLEGGLAALRRSPSSYVNLWYFSQSVRFWVTTGNERHLVRYRITPDVSRVEEPTGPVVTRKDYVKRDRAKKERRPADYLRRELKLKLQGPRTVTLKLQAQFHRPRPGDGPTYYNPAVDWHEGLHPWFDIGEIVLEDAISDEACEKLTFNTDNAPSSLGIPVSPSIFDPRSIADSERRVMRRVQGLRIWLVDVLGLSKRAPKPMCF